MSQMDRLPLDVAIASEMTLPARAIGESGTCGP